MEREERREKFLHHFIHDEMILFFRFFSAVEIFFSHEIFNRWAFLRIRREEEKNEREKLLSELSVIKYH